MNYYPKATKLLDSQLHGHDSQAELFIVEGDSASSAVATACNRQFQAVIPMQGKPLNAQKASLRAIQSYDLYRETLLALGYPQLLSPQAKQAERPLDDCRFGKLILLFDPDADGIHCGALTLIFLHRMLPELIEAGKVFVVRAPLFRFEIQASQHQTATTLPPAQNTHSHPSRSSRILYASLEEQARSMARELDAEGYSYKRHRYRGLASLDRSTLKNLCLDPATRKLEPLTPRDAAAALAIFGGS